MIENLHHPKKKKFKKKNMKYQVYVIHTKEKLRFLNPKCQLIIFGTYRLIIAAEPTKNI